MLIHEMESLLRNVDARLARVEQILPTLALKDDVRALQERVDANHRHMLVLHEDVKGDIQLLAEHLSDQMERLSDVSERVADVSERVAGMSERLSDMSERLSGMSDRLSGVSDRLSDISDILRRLDRDR